MRLDVPTRPVAALRLRVAIRGAVQGVGFRPFVYRLATEAGLVGWVNNSPAGVLIEVEGSPAALEAFLLRLDRERPPRSFIQSLEPTYLDPVGYREFVIRPSEATGGRTTLILPDSATCPDCLRELRDPADRRYRYPFINCTNCGPRFTIITGLPYDRPSTTMASFPLCPACRAEYEDPGDRRFHAQPVACPVCGPHLEWWDAQGRVLAGADAALAAATAMLRAGGIVAVKGLGGFHLMVDARDEVAVRRLRARKQREEKPFALLFPDLAAIEAVCTVSPLEARLLESAEAPIVLLDRRAPAGGIAPAVAPGNPTLGVMLPYTPLHHLLLTDLGFPVVATSGNLSDEPICIDEQEALARLGEIADGFLVHNRPIARHVDDSVVRVVLGRELVLRRARGYAPLPVHVAAPLPPLLAMGGHLKNSVALAVGQDLFVSQHIGDLETVAAGTAFAGVIADFERLYATTPGAVACDAHPDYYSTRYARGMGLPVIPVQHHVAHVLAAMAENDLAGPALGVAWDGTGYGDDGTIWGGEFFRVTPTTVQRVAHWRPFGLPGGDAAVRRPRRSALGLLYEAQGAAALEAADLPPVAATPAAERAVLATMLRRGVFTPRTSSVGRLFDAVAALLGLRQQAGFEGQAAMDLEFALIGVTTDREYDLLLQPPAGAGAPAVLDWAPALDGILRDIRAGRSRGLIAATFHNTLVAGILLGARHAGEPQVVLGGGCFQNRYLLERAVTRLRAAGFRPYWPQRIPPNDGGIALGQLVAASRLGEESHVSCRSRAD